LFYESKGSHDDPLLSHPKGENLDVFEFIARVITQIPEPRKHGVHYFGAYASSTRAFRKKQGLTLHPLGDNDNSKAEPELSPRKRAAMRKTWARLIKRVYQVDPLKCECGGTLHVISFITEHKVIRKILDHSFAIWISETPTLALLLTTNPPLPQAPMPTIRTTRSSSRQLITESDAQSQASGFFTDVW
jgi:hypothetical protein